MGFNSVPLLATGDWIDAAWGNTYWRDNLAALYPYTTAGDIAYGVSAGGALARLGLTVGGMLYGGASAPAWLAKPSVDSLLKNTSAGSPSWLAITGIPGALHAKGKVDFSPGGQVFAGGWADISFASLSLTLGVTCTVVVRAYVTGYNSNAGTGNGFYVRADVNGTPDAGTIPFDGSQTEVRNGLYAYEYYFTGVTAGTRLVKLQCQANGSSNIVERGRLIAQAFVE